MEGQWGGKKDWSAGRSIYGASGLLLSVDFKPRILSRKSLNILTRNIIFLLTLITDLQ